MKLIFLLLACLVAVYARPQGCPVLTCDPCPSTHTNKFDNNGCKTCGCISRKLLRFLANGDEKSDMEEIVKEAFGEVLNDMEKKKIIH